MTIIMGLMRELNELLRREFSAPMQSRSMGIQSHFGDSFTDPLSDSTLCCLFALNVGTTILFNWIHHHFLFQSIAYFVKSWFQAAVTTVVLHFMTRRKSSSLKLVNFKKKFQYLWPLILLYMCTVVLNGMDFTKDTGNAAGSEFYQISLMLSVPAVLACVNAFCLTKFPTYINISFTALAGLQLMVLCKDPDFEFSFATCIYSFIYAAIYGCYIVVFKEDLSQEHGLLILYYLNLSQLAAFPFIAYFRGELSIAFRNEVPELKRLLQMLCIMVLLAFLGLLKMISNILLLKGCNPLHYILTINVTWVPSTCILAFVYRKDYMVSSFRSCWFFFLEIVILLLRGFVTENDEEISRKDQKLEQ